MNLCPSCEMWIIHLKIHIHIQCIIVKSIIQWKRSTCKCILCNKQHLICLDEQGDFSVNIAETLQDYQSFIDADIKPMGHGTLRIFFKLLNYIVCGFTLKEGKWNLNVCHHAMLPSDHKQVHLLSHAVQSNLWLWSSLDGQNPLNTPESWWYLKCLWWSNLYSL